MIKYFAPLMVACSSDNLEFPVIKKDIKEAGFDMAMSAPLNTQNITTIAEKVTDRNKVLIEFIDKRTKFKGGFFVQSEIMRRKFSASLPVGN